MKKILVLCLALVMVLALAACGAPSAAPATPAESAAPAEPVKAASAEELPSGEIVLYSTHTEHDLDAVISCFNDIYPDINVEVVNGGAGELIARLQGESASPVADLMWGGLIDSDGPVHADIFEEWVTEHDAENMEGYHSNNGLYSVDHLSTVVFCVNTELEAELGLNIQSYEDLLDPKLKGLVASADPNSSASAWTNLINIMAVYGNDTEETWDYIAKLMPNLVITGSSSSCFKSVQAGEYVVGLTYEDGAVTLLKDGATNLRLQYPTNGTSASAIGSALVKGGPNPENAKLFINFLCSAEGQTTIAAYQEGTLRYTNSGYTAPEGAWLPPTDQITWIPKDNEYLSQNKEAILEHWNNLYAEVVG